MKKSFVAVALAAAACWACSGGGGAENSTNNPKTYAVSGTISGLTGTLALRNNGVDDLSLVSNGTFTFGTKVASGSAYSVIVKKDPLGQNCLVTNGSGTVRDANISNVTVSCTTHNIVFVTSTSQTGNMGGLAGADAICAARASAAGLPGTYVAWLSTSGTGSVNAKDRLGSARGWIRTDSLPFTDRVSDLTAGTILYPPRLDEFGADVGKNVMVLTATKMDGVLFQDAYAGSCQDWTSTSGGSTAGYADGGSMIWTYYLWNTSCSATYRMYCFGTDHANALAPLTRSGRLAFISWQSFLPGGGVAAADAICQGEASGRGFPGTYKALLAQEGVSAASRFSASGPSWARPDGVVIGSLSDLEANLFTAPIEQRADGSYAGNTGVWVGANSLSNIASGTTCSSWTSNSSVLNAGSTASGRSGVDGQSSACEATWLSVWCLQE